MYVGYALSGVGPVAACGRTAQGSGTCVETAQTQTVAHDAYAAQSHGCASDHGVEQESAYWVEYAGGDGHADHVVEECPEEILAYGAYGELRETYRLGYLARIRRDDCHACGRDGYVTATAHGDTEVGLGQRRAVVDAVAGHCRVVSCGAQRLQVFGLLLGQHRGAEGGDARHAGHALCRGGVVAREHHGLYAHRAERLDGLARTLAYAVRNARYGQNAALVVCAVVGDVADGEPYDALAVGLET